MAQIILQICLYLFALIAVIGGSLQLYLGQPETSPRLDNSHRFMAGIYLSTGLICFWVARTLSHELVLVGLLALAAFIGGIGRIISIRKVGIPQPAALWLGYLIPELILPLIMLAAIISLRP